MLEAEVVLRLADFILTPSGAGAIASASKGHASESSSCLNITPDQG